MLEDFIDRELPSLHGVKRDMLEKYSSNVKIRMGKYYDNLDWEIFRTKILLEPLPGCSYFERMKYFFKTLPSRFKLFKLKLIRKKNQDILYMDM